MEQIIEDKIYTDIDVSNKTINDISYSYCKFVNCSFKETIFKNVTFNDCIFENCSLVNIVSKDSIIKYGTFINSTVIGLNWNSLSAKFSAVIEKINDCVLKYNNFENMVLNKIDFGKSQILTSTFFNSSLSECNFADCNLKDTAFSKCDLQKSNFVNSHGFNIDVMTCKLKNAKFSLSNIDGLVSSLGIKIE